MRSFIELYIVTFDTNAKYNIFDRRVKDRVEDHQRDLYSTTDQITSKMIKTVFFSHL